MRDRMERLVILPFSIGCVSESSVAVAVHHRRSNNKPETPNSPPTRIREDEEESLSGESMKNSFRFLAISKPDISNGIHRLFKGFKSFSQLFVYKDEDMEELEREMEIGFPTDVKHVTHIGWDGSASINNNNKGLENLMTPDQLLSLTPFSLRQFDLATPSQTDHNAPLPQGSA